MNKHHPNEDGTLDGCAWVTMEQSEELMLDFKEESNSERGSPRRKRRASRQKRKLSDFNLNFFKMWPTKEPIKWKFDNEHSEFIYNFPYGICCIIYIIYYALMIVICMWVCTCIICMYEYMHVCITYYFTIQKKS